MENKMFCYQCQEAVGNTGCTFAGVCGKPSTLANLMDIYKDALKKLSALINGKDGVEEEQRYIMEGLFKLITNANFDEKVFEREIACAYEYINKHSDKEVTYSITGGMWKTVGTLKEENEDVRGLRELIITGLMGLAAYHSHAFRLGFESKEVHEFTVDTLAKLDSTSTLEDLVSLVDKTGEMGVNGMALLDEANTSTYGNPEISQVKLGVGNRPGILISGHDLHDLEALLEQSKDAGIDIYTHSEMLPAHYYPKLKKYDHLYGNYGNSWWKQVEEFETFNGPILFTTNCIVPPKKDSSYKDMVYTTGNAGFDGFKHVQNGDFSEIIELAKTCKAPTAIEEGEITGGFAHSQVFDLADTIVENIKNGSIRKFFVMGGCDGRHDTRDYYKEFAEGLNKDTIILTAGCAKYRYNKLGLGDINGIPRVLDAGQCNDSYSLAIIALKLKEIFELNDINDLPIAYNIAWYEQKAVIVLLALLHLGVKNIKLGPTLPAFISPNVAQFLIDTYNISTISTVEEDLSVIG
ncbi:MAG: hydroxylamine reductase [Erysipelotrichales bacterium]